MKKRILSILLALTTLLTLVPTISLGAAASDAAPTLSTVLSDMSSYYSSALSFGSDPNLDWALADMVASGTTISGNAKQDYVDYVVSHATADSAAADLARYIITLKALGYDATKIDTTGNGTYFNAVDAMMGKDETSIYSTPYVLIALQQYGNTYSMEIDSLINTIISSKLSGGGWGYASMDADTTGPVLLALAPYYSTRADVKNAVDEALAQLSGLQDSTGAIYSAYGYGACSTGILIPGLVALGINPDTDTANGFADGLLLLYHADSRFQVYSGDNYSDEQGFRGLVAADHFSSSGYRIYDFSAKASNAAVASVYYTNCLVTFSVVPADATIVLKDSSDHILSPHNGSSYDLAAGTYTYTVSGGGYAEKTGTITVSSTDALHTKKSVSVSLSSAPNTNEDITVTVNVKTHNASDCNNGSNLYTYKHNSSAYYNIVSETVTLKSGSTVFDALDAACTAAGVSYTEASYGYVGTINGLSEFDHGSNSGWLYKVGNTLPDTTCREYVLTSNCTVTWLFSDDYTKETSPTIAEFADCDPNAWYNSAVDYVLTEGLFQGTSNTTFEPMSSTSRAMFVTTLWRMEGEPVVGASGFADLTQDWYTNAVNWAASAGIVKGYSNTTFGPDDTLTREQMVTILFRFAQYKGNTTNADGSSTLTGYEDTADITEYARSAFQWAVDTGIVNGTSDHMLSPCDHSTRAAAAALLMRFSAYAQA